MSGYFNIDNQKEKTEKEKLLNALKDYYQKNVKIENKRNIENPYIKLIEYLEQEKLIDNTFRNYSSSPFYKVLYKDRKKGMMTVISKENFEKFYNNNKTKNVDFDNIYFNSYSIPHHQIRTKYLFDILNDRLNRLIEKGKSNFSKEIVLNKDKRNFIINTIDNLFNTYIIIKSRIKDVQKEDREYFLLIREKLNQVLKDLIVSYYDLLPTKTINKLKNDFANLHLLFTKNDLKSFNVAIRIERKLDDLRAKLIDKKLIDDISSMDFKLVFTDNYIENKINWIGDAGELYYFIKRFVDINNSDINNKIKYKYILTSKCFLLNNNDIYPDKFKHQKKPKNKSKIEKIDRVINLINKN